MDVNCTPMPPQYSASPATNPAVTVNVHTTESRPTSPPPVSIPSPSGMDNNTFMQMQMMQMQQQNATMQAMGMYHFYPFIIISIVMMYRCYLTLTCRQ